MKTALAIDLTVAAALAVLALAAPAASGAPAPVQGLPRGFVQVQPAARAGQAGTPRQGLPQLRLAQGRFFSYAMPPGWQVTEDGQFALTLIAPDRRAVTVMVGNAGVPLNYPPGQYVYEKLMALRPQALQLGAPRPVQPIAGFAQALEFPVSYVVDGAPCRGIATLHVAPAYDSAVMAVTAALSDARQWDGYATWLPLVARQVAATDGAAFGMRGIMAQNLRNSTAYAEAARQYRDWSQRNWQSVTDARNASQDRNNAQFREALGGVQTYANPYDTRAPVELPATHQYYWVNEKGVIVGTNDAGLDPNTGSTHDWRRMGKVPGSR